MLMLMAKESTPGGDSACYYAWTKAPDNNHSCVTISLHVNKAENFSPAPGALG
jgi:hypothetical protein